MTTIPQLGEEREKILRELGQLREIRRGSVTEQYLDTKLKDGSKVRNGPYLLYTYKEKGRTVSRRLVDADEVARYRQQIDGFRRFEILMTRLREIGESISDQRLAAEGVKKTTQRKRRSRRSSR